MANDNNALVPVNHGTLDALIRNDELSQYREEPYKKILDQLVSASKQENLDVLTKIGIVNEQEVEIFRDKLNYTTHGLMYLHAKTKGVTIYDKLISGIGVPVAVTAGVLLGAMTGTIVATFTAGYIGASFLQRKVIDPRRFKEYIGNFSFNFTDLDRNAVQLYNEVRTRKKTVQIDAAQLGFFERMRGDSYIRGAYTGTMHAFKSVHRAYKMYKLILKDPELAAQTTELLNS